MCLASGEFSSFIEQLPGYLERVRASVEKGGGVFCHTRARDSLISFAGLLVKLKETGVDEKSLDALRQHIILEAGIEKKK